MHELSANFIFSELSTSVQSHNTQKTADCLKKLNENISDLNEEGIALAKALLNSCAKEPSNPLDQARYEKLAKRIEFISHDLATQVAITQKPLKQEQWEDLQNSAAKIQNLFSQATDLHKEAKETLKISPDAQTLKKDNFQKKKNPTATALPTEEWEPVKETLRRAITENLPKTLTPPDFTSFSLVGKDKRTDYNPSKSDFAHLHGDVFIHETGLEGSTSFRMMNLFHHYLKESEKGKWNNKKDIDALSTMIEESFPLTNLINDAIRASLFDQPIPKILESEFNKALNALEKGQSLLFAGGWIGQPGHGVYLRLTKLDLDNEQFTLRIYNKGAGIGTFHPSAEIEGLEKYHPFVDISNIPEKAISYTSFMLPLLQMNSQINTLAGVPARYSENDLYDAWLSNLGGAKVSYPQDLDHYTTPQHSGICAWAGLEAVAQDFLNPTDNSRFLHEIKLQSLIDFFDYHALELETDEELRLLIKQSAQQFARESLADYQRQIISQEELRSVYATVTDILGQVETAEKKDLALRHREAPQADFSKIPAKPLCSFETVKTPVILSTHVKSTVESKLASPYSIPPSLPGNSLADTPGLLLSLRKCLDYSTQPYNHQDYANLGAWITQVLESLPLPTTGENDFWSALKQEDREGCMLVISQLSELLLCARHKLPLDKHQRMEDIVNVYSALTMLHKLAVLSDIPPGIKKWSLPWHNFGMFFGITDELEGETIQSLQYGYYKNRVSGEYNLYDSAYASRAKQVLDYIKISPNVYLENAFDLGPYLKDPEQSKYEPERHFVYEYLRQPHNLAKSNPRYDLSNPLYREIDRAAVALCDLNHLGIMPPSFCALKKQVLIAEYFLEGDLHANNLEEGIHPLWIRLQGELKEDAVFQMVRNGKTLGIDSKEIMNMPLGAQTHKEYIWKHYHHSYQDLRDQDLQKILSLTNAWDWDESWIQSASFEEEGFKKLGVTEIRELMQLRASANSNAGELHKELQIPRTLSYFQAHLLKLKDPDYQTFIKLLLFEKNYIAEYLRNAPECTEKLLGFAVYGYSTFLEDGDYKACAFCAGLLKMLQDAAAAAAQENIPENHRKIILSAIEKSPAPQAVLHSLMELSQKSNDSEALALSSAQYVATFSPIGQALTKDEAVDLLQAACKFHSFPAVDIRDSFLMHQVTKTLSRRLEQLRSWADSPLGDSFLSQAAANLTQNPAVLNAKWNCSAFPLCVSVDGQFTLNIREGRFYERGKTISVLPSLITSHPYFQELFGSQNLQVMQENPSCFMSTDGSTRFRLESGRLVIQRKLKEGYWYQYIPKEELSDSLKTGLRSKALYEFHSAWISCDDKPYAFEILFIDIAQGWKPKHSAELLEVPRPAIGKVKQLAQGNMSLVDIYQKDNGREKEIYEFLTSLEELSYINFWAKGGELKEIELPRLALHFKVKKEDGILKAYCSEFPGYFIAPHQSMRELHGFSDYLVLENEKREKQVLVPHQKIEVLKKGALTTSFKLKREYPSPKEKVERRYFAYGINRITGCMHSQDSTSNLFLGYLFVAQKSYVRAQECLRLSERKLSEFSPLEKQLFHQIQLLHKQNGDGAPKASAAYLVAQGVYFLNQQKYAKTTQESVSTEYNEFVNDLQKEHLNYLTIEEHATTLKLRPEEEIALLKNLPSQALDRRLALRLEKLTDRAFAPSVKIRGMGWERKWEKEPPSFSETQQAIERAFQAPTPDFEAEKYSFFRPGAAFAKHFRLFYAWAVEPNQPQKALLKQILSLMKHDPLADQNLRLFLLEVLEHPNKFPSSEEFYKQVTKPNFNKPKWLSQVRKGIAAQMEQLEESRWKVPPPLPKLEDKKKPDAQKMGKAQQVFLAPLNPRGRTKPVLIANPSSLFKVTPKTQENSQIAGLQTALHVGKADASDEREIARLTQDIQDYAAGDELPVGYQLDPANLKPLKAQLAIQKGQLYKLAFSEEEEILALANKFPPEIEKALQKGMEIAGTTRAPVAMQDLLLAFLRHSPEDYHKLNPSLSAADIEKLNQSIATYLDHMTLRQQAMRGFEILEKIEKLGANVPLNDPNYENLSRHLFSEIGAQRSYPVQKHPEYLVFEYLSNVRLRPIQVENLEKMLRAEDKPAPDVILQMIMGAGKSKVFLPILALKKADGDRLSIIVVPEALYRTTTQNMLIQSGEIFSQQAHELDFDRNTEFTPAKLQNILNKLNEVREKRHYLIMTPKSLHCLSLKYREALYLQAHAEDFDPALEKKIHLMEEILQLIKEKGDAILDEADLILNSKQEVNFTLGKPEILRPERRRLIADIYRCIAASPYFLKASTITEEEHNAKWKGEITGLFVEKVKNSPQNPLHTYFQTIGDKQGLLMNYLLDAGDAESEAWIAGQPEDIRNLLSIAKEQLNTLLKLTLSKHCNVDYGFSKDPKKMLAVPYLGNNTPSPTSEFGNHYETANYSVQTCLIKGIPVSSLTHYVRQLQKNAVEEIQEDRSLHLHETAAYKKFDRLCGELKIKADFLHLRHPAEFENLAKIINQDPEKILNFVEDVVLPEITIPQKKISSNPQSLVELFATVQGFTGTPWNGSTFPEKLKTLPHAGTDGKTLSLLWENSREQNHTHVLKETTFSSVLNAIIASKGGSQGFAAFHAIIDTGSLFRGIDNEKVARELLKRLNETPSASPVKGVVFFKGDELYVIEMGNADPVPFSRSMLSPEERFTYYDQRHARGTDIPQSAFAKAFVTIGNDLALRDFLQGVWRLRELDKGQSVEFLVLPEAAEAITALLPAQPKEISLQHILRLVIHNQAVQKESHLLAAAKQKIRHAAEREVMALIRKGHLDSSLRKQILLKIEHLLAPSLGDHPYNAFGKHDKKEDTSKVLDALIEETAKTVASALALTGEPLKKAEARLTKLIYEELPSAKIALLPGKIPSSASTHRDLQVEVEAEQEVEQETQKEQEVRAEGNPQKSTPYIHWEWQPSKLWQASEDIRRSVAPVQVELLLAAGGEHFFSRNQISQFITCSLRNPLWVFSHATTKSKFQPPVFVFNDVVKNQPSLAYCQNLFDEELLATFNFCPVFNSKFIEPGLNFPVNNLLVIQDPNDPKNVYLMLLNQKDACFFFDHLRGERSQAKGSANKKIGLCLYDLNLGVLQNGEKTFTDKELIDIPKFARLLVQAKFLSGNLNYTAKEKKILREWLKDHDPQMVEKFFIEHILKYSPKKQTLYAQSAVRQCLSP